MTMFNFSFLPKYAFYFWQGIAYTLLLSVISVLLAILPALLLALMRLSKNRVIRAISGAYEYEGRSVSIRAMERVVGDTMLEHAERILPSMKGKKTGKRVAIIGAGPAGLAASFYIALAGHAVTVFDRHPEIGGMLAYGVPGYRLPKDILGKYRRIWESIGVVFKTGVEVGRDISPDELTAGYDAVLSAPGCPLPRKAGVPGEDAEGVFSAIGFLEDAASAFRIRADGSGIRSAARSLRRRRRSRRKRCAF